MRVPICKRALFNNFQAFMRINLYIYYFSPVCILALNLKLTTEVETFMAKGRIPGISMEAE